MNRANFIKLSTELKDKMRSVSRRYGAIGAGHAVFRSARHRKWAYPIHEHSKVFRCPCLPVGGLRRGGPPIAVLMQFFGLHLDFQASLEYLLRTIDRAQALRLCVNDAIRRKIALEVGISSVAVGEIVRHAGALLIAAFATRVSEGRENAMILFGALMSPNINARINYDCAGQCELAALLSELGCAGLVLVDAVNKQAAVFSDHVGAQTGVPTDVAYKINLRLRSDSRRTNQAPHSSRRG
ncbi:hypothetical protein [Paraburkholderia graminis]|uniref:hypothetical protein n=1 Tax=Paraburkholderia graminis TaxID=60548 RepID=UPI000688E13F